MTTQRERDVVVEFVPEGFLLSQALLPHQLELEAVRVRRRRPHGDRPARHADRLLDAGLTHVSVQRASRFGVGMFFRGDVLAAARRTKQAVPPGRQSERGRGAKGRSRLSRRRTIGRREYAHRASRDLRQDYHWPRETMKNEPRLVGGRRAQVTGDSGIACEDEVRPARHVD